ncbi:hypothetical protein HN588_17580 [Candidatus Bathyarchaeota archaeon]|jgi:hypothetical protein|nr:hypothetical protein [Candidatus Bathyarchaeota archaeon]
MNPEAAKLSDISTYIGNIFTAAIPLIGLISFVMILVGGFTILTSGGNPEGMKKGTQTITLSVAGLALAVLSWLILVFIKNFTGVDVTQFQFGF